MTTLEPLCYINFLLAGEQRNASHLPEIKFYRIVGFVQQIGADPEIQILLPVEFQFEVSSALGRQFRFLEINALVIYGHSQIIQIIGGSGLLGVQAAPLLRREVMVVSVLPPH